MKKVMKKTISIVMAVVLALSVVQGVLGVGKIETHAGGWLDYAQNIDLDTTYADSVSKVDYTTGSDYYYDVYKFIVPSKGTITIYTESSYSDCVNSNTEYGLYKSSNVDSAIWSGERNNSDYDYSSARDVYYGTLQVKLNAGTYYLVQDTYHWKDSDYAYDITLKYTPSITSPKIKSVKRAKKAFSASWYKVSGATGYELQYSTNKSFKGSTTKTVKLKKASITSKKIKKLKKNKTYYVRVRSYKILKVAGSNKTYRSKWSPKKTVKTK